MARPIAVTPEPKPAAPGLLRPRLAPPPEPEEDLAPPPPPGRAAPASDPALSIEGIDMAEIEQMCIENEELRARVAQLEKSLEEAQSGEGGASLTAERTRWEEQQREFEGLLEEKSDVIRNLHRKVRELELELSEGGGRGSPQGAREEELLSLHEELERERQQLKDDEKTLMDQMREMEVQMSRERAEFARQRAELQRLHAELRHEMELAARDSNLRERLAPLMRRHQDVMNRRGGGGVPSPNAPPPSNTAVPRIPTPPPAPPQADDDDDDEPRRDSGLLRRFFG